LIPKKAVLPQLKKTAVYHTKNVSEKHLLVIITSCIAKLLEYAGHLLASLDKCNLTLNEWVYFKQWLQVHQ